MRLGKGTDMQAVDARRVRAVSRADVPAGLSAVARGLRSLAKRAGPKSSGPRAYRREGFPEIELYQIMAGRRDRFDGL